MKRLFCYLIMVVLLSGCKEITNETKPEHNSSIHLYAKPQTFNFNGHRYIYFPMSTYQGGVVHDPDCPCNKQK